jgi:LysR family carnitine catabolism transcriptional activator
VDRRQLEYFLAVAENLSFTNASHALHMTQPSLSQAIKGLERELGVELFHRLRNGIRLTSAGEALVGPARQAIRDFVAATAAVGSVADLSRGRLDIAAAQTLASDPLASLIVAFHERFPGVRIRIANPGRADVLDLVRDGETELAVAMAPASANDLSVLRFPREEVYVALPPSTDPAPDSVIPARELERIDLIAVTSNKPVVLELLADLGVTPRFSVETAHRDTVLPLVLGGVGAALVPRVTAADARARGAVVCRMEPPLMREVLLAHRPTHLTPAAEAFVAMATEQAALESEVLA